MKKIFGSMIAIFLLISLVTAIASDITIKTDKKLYQTGENITFTLYNNNSTTFEIDFKPSIVNSTGNCVWGCFWIAVYNPIIVPPGKNYSLTWDQKGVNGQISPGFYKGRLGDYYSNEFEISNLSTGNISTDILAHYRGLGQNPDIVETSDLLMAADDWRNDMILPGFSAPLTTSQLLKLADEWINAPQFANINIVDFNFQPQTINVVKGTEVTWTNKGMNNHTVTSDTELFNSDVIVPGNTFSFIFNETGNYSYHCHIHHSMTGQVNVS